jgi:hypothetical protein
MEEERMKLKRGTLFLMVLVATLALVLAGCGNLFGSDDDDDPAPSIDFNEDFTVETADPLGGKIAFYDPNGDETEDTFGGNKIRLVSGRFGDDISFSSDSIYYLNGSVFIGENGDASSPIAVTDKTELTIEKGTEIRGFVSSTNPGALIIDRGGKINASGTKADPIVFTSAKDPGQRAPGDWGGLIINGFARVQKGTATGEGSTGTYGGGTAGNQVDDDSSGTLRYVRVEFAGTLFSPDNELNGIAFQGVGNGTTVEYIQVHQNADDGVEFFGGTVSVKYVLLTGNQDDSLDHDDGWAGSAQYVMIQQYPGGDHGIEGDGDATDEFEPVSAILANFTYVGSTDTDDGFRFRRSARPGVYNSLITNVASGENSIDEKTTADDGSDESAGTVTYRGVVVTSDVESGETDWATGNGNAQISNDDFTGWVANLSGGAYSFPSDPTYSGGTAQTVPTTNPVTGDAVSVDDTNFIGAFDPGASALWTDGWTTFAEN